MNKFYTIYDSKAGYYTRPFTARTKGEALRMFQQAANDVQTQVGQYPEDFILFEIGTWDDITGNIEHQAHISLGKALDYVEKDRKLSPTLVLPPQQEMEGRN